MMYFLRPILRDGLIVGSTINPPQDEAVLFATNLGLILRSRARFDKIAGGVSKDALRAG